MNDNIIEVFNAYNNALAKGDFPALFETLSDDIKWHQPGKNSLSGEIIGKQALGEHLSQFVRRSNGTFRVETNWVSSNDCFVAANVTFIAERENDTLNMNGIDLFKIENGQIQEVWLFSSNQDVEDKFWK